MPLPDLTPDLVRRFERRLAMETATNAVREFGRALQESIDRDLAGLKAARVAAELRRKTEAERVDALYEQWKESRDA